jgi:hypothetical protein
MIIYELDKCFHLIIGVAMLWRLMVRGHSIAERAFGDMNKKRKSGKQF